MGFEEGGGGRHPVILTVYAIYITFIKKYLCVSKRYHF
jgi:hypothetical protein